MKNSERALVTGASGGLGAGVAKRLASRGTEVWLAARREAELQSVADEIVKAGGRAHVCVIDLADPDATHERLSALDRESGGIDLVVANAAIAGIAATQPIEKLTWPEARRLLDVNLLGNVATLMAFIPRMVERGHGHLVAVSSLAADMPTPRTAPYGASKAGLSHFLLAAGIGLRERGIDTTVLQPGFMRTPAAETTEEPMPFIVELDDAVDIVIKSIDKKRKFLRFPWPLAAMQGGVNLLPGFLRDKVIAKATKEPAKPG